MENKLFVVPLFVNVLDTGTQIWLLQLAWYLGVGFHSYIHLLILFIY